MIIECIKEGFNLTHKNWQLILIRIVVTIITLISLFIFMGIPIFVAIAYLGVDIAHAKELLPHLLKNPLEFISRYLGLVFLIVTAFIFYLLFSSILFLYTLSGTLGVLKNSAVYVKYKFSLSSFFKVAKEHFFPLFWLFSILVSGFVILLIVFIISGGIGVGILHSITGTETSLGVFFNSFFALSIIVFGSIIFFVAIVFIVYSVITLVIEGKGVVDSIKRTFNFLKERPKAFLFYIILLVGIIIANILLLVIEMPFSMILVSAPLISIVLSIINAVFQNYVAIVLWSSLFVFYIKSTNYPVYYTEYDI